MADPRIKQIRIKTGVVKRLTKEKSSYEKEVEDQERRIQKMKDEGKDEYDIKKQGEVLQESKAMVPDCLKRLNTAYSDLVNLLASESDLKSAEEYTQAEVACAAAKEMLGL
ncbi:tubulin-specific chaperone A [Octopus bimaculoides]|uniref:Tubulin-specific chaperone A n=1 Tax=Octopus bimaculoides TaxID=37653 RepID=A0A0L8G2J3_OCTBM|nr:tubulin-specific chaperone A [Octopus bimaculoides]|eukprot:XP_014784686.1 PREDICTED: tubulin-specific chaperone A-like [Octopus bimaculoides]